MHAQPGVDLILSHGDLKAYSGAELVQETKETGGEGADEGKKRGQ